MGLCQNVYRRGALYWWRRRFVDPAAGRSRTIAISLRVHKPAQARQLGAALNVRAHQCADRVRLGMETFDSARDGLTSFIDGVAWHFSETALSGLDRLAARAAKPTGALATHEQMEDILLDLARDAEAEFARNAFPNRQHAALQWNGLADDREIDAAAGEAALAIIYRTVAEGGRNARILDEQRQSLIETFGSDITIFVETEVAKFAREESLTGDSWSLGPSRFLFEDKLLQLGCKSSSKQVRGLRHQYLLICASLLEDLATRKMPQSVATSVLDKLRRENSVPYEISHVTHVSSREPVAVDPRLGKAPSKAIAGTKQIAVPPTGLSSKSFMQHVETLIRQKSKKQVDAKGRELHDGKTWDQKTCNQHRSLAKLFSKFCGTDDPHLMTQEHIGAFRSMLDDLPKNWGKSPDDAARSIDDILARAQDLDEQEVGLAGTTIDRYMTQLSNLLKHFKANGIVIGEVYPSLRTGGKSLPRGVFTIEELEAIFSSSVWRGCAGAADRLTPGAVVVRDALYWIPLLGRYELGRLHEIAGLMVEDIDFDSAALHFRDNPERKLKSTDSQRRQPIVPELIRLGFLQYAAAMRDAGEKLLFPCLRARGEKTQLSNLFYKEFKKVLEAILPRAASERKSFHSLRKDGNSSMINENINDPIRHAVMGHAHSGTNEKHYLDAVFDKPKLLALASIPNVTSHLSLLDRTSVPS